MITGRSSSADDERLGADRRPELGRGDHLDLVKIRIAWEASFMSGA